MKKNKLVLRKNGNTYMVSPHRSGDLNSYLFEEVGALDRIKTRPNNIKPSLSVSSKSKPNTVLQNKLEPKINININNKIKQTTQTVIKKGLMIGINYNGTNIALPKSIQTSENLKKFLITNRYFNNADLTLMTDFTANNLIPTKKNIIMQLDQLIKFARSNANKQVILLVSYIGHGNNGAEVIIPIDYQQSGTITNDDIQSKFINQLPSNVKLISFFDAGYSESILEMKYTYEGNEKNTYTVIGKLIPTVCDTIVLYSKDQSQLLNALLSVYKEVDSIGVLMMNIKSWGMHNNGIVLVSGKFIDIDGKLFVR